MQEFEFNEPKFYEMVVYFLDAFRGDETFGRIKLAKLIYNSDFRSMRRLGHPISGATYRKDTFGHNPTQLKTTALDLVARGDAVESRSDEDEPRVIDPQSPRRLILRDDRNPDLRFFPTDELPILKEVADEYRFTPAIAMSDEAHKTLGWQLADLETHEIIPMETVYLAKPTADDLAHAEIVALQRNLDFAPAGD
jgi:hypothetical protein